LREINRAEKESEITRKIQIESVNRAEKESKIEKKIHIERD
jgi:hypothetical protein